jgi:hypothetical protein
MLKDIRQAKRRREPFPRKTSSLDTKSLVRVRPPSFAPRADIMPPPSPLRRVGTIPISGHESPGVTAGRSNG